MNRIRLMVLANSLRGFALHARDGRMGMIDDFYFSDQEWKVRHVVVGIEHLFDMRRVLVSPEAFGSADWREENITVDATREGISVNPAAGTVMPNASGSEGGYDSHLRSTRNLQNLEVDAEDATPLGRIADFLVDIHSWEIPFLLVRSNDGRVFVTNHEIVKSIDENRRTVAAGVPRMGSVDWLEYDPHHMALMSTVE